MRTYKLSTNKPEQISRLSLRIKTLLVKATSNPSKTSLETESKFFLKLGI
ncbi:hypothetical protein M9Y08_18245 [Clostridioides difficile]|nr:hypothetical protein [Clostridioides difficile]